MGNKTFCMKNANDSFEEERGKKSKQVRKKYFQKNIPYLFHFSDKALHLYLTMHLIVLQF